LAAPDRQILLMTHLVVGYPSLDANRTMLRLMAEHDVDVVELQMPFSEPVADGPIFVRANQEALTQGLRLDTYFEFLAHAGETCSFPRLFMGYYNTVFRAGHEPFCARLEEVGASGFILPDLPYEEYGDLFEVSAGRHLDPILLMTPTNTEARLGQLGARARGFVYAVARKGVTGRRTELQEELYGFLETCRAATDLPLALGFGLRGGADLRTLHGHVEIGIVGSALLQAWEEGGETAYAALLGELGAARA
jgi:tryptophan synthase alpha chain